MMNIPPEQADRLSLWKYQALLYHWNEAHNSDPDLTPPDPAHTQRLIDRINSNPALNGKGAALQTA